MYTVQNRTIDMHVVHAFGPARIDVTQPLHVFVPRLRGWLKSNHSQDMHGRLAPGNHWQVHHQRGTNATWRVSVASTCASHFKHCSTEKKNFLRLG